MKLKSMFIIAVLALAGFAAEPVCSGTHFAADALKPYVESGELPGAISVFYQNGKQEVACVGYADVAADVAAKRPIKMDDPYMQCSQTKGFCGVTIAILVEEGKLNLDDPVSKYLPEFGTLWVKTSEKDGVRTLTKAKNVLTVRMVLNHTGGFPFEIPAKQGNIKGGGWSGGAPLRQTAAIAAACPILFEPGTKVQYSNTGIDIGAAVVEVVTGEKWENFLKKRVLDPLGMKDSWFWPTDAQLAHQVEMYTCQKGAPAKYQREASMQQRPYNDGHVFPSAGAGLWTTANDQLKFYKMLMNLAWARTACASSRRRRSSRSSPCPRVRRAWAATRSASRRLRRTAKTPGSDMAARGARTAWSTGTRSSSSSGRCSSRAVRVRGTARARRRLTSSSRRRSTRPPRRPTRAA